ncbi:helix-turn-helix protein [Actinocorallia herbida]|uniref:Helix-turn-helix protein n=2 Tax=Actinocorallia herbida TaxID=58109 RepID=A0A3N1CYC7_9ACTN|nr:helix-turn-helix protein [Actinocorallia herbida]
MLVLDTADHPNAERAEAYHAVAEGEAGTCSIEFEPDERGEIWQRLEVWQFGPVSMIATSGTGMRYRRTPRHMRMDSKHSISLLTHPVGTGGIVWNDYQDRLCAQTLNLEHRTDAYYEYTWSGTGMMLACVIDFDRLELPAATIRDAIPLASRSGVAPLLLNQMRALHRNADLIAEDPGAEAIGGSLVALSRALVASVTSDAGTRREVAQETLVPRILAYVRANLADPELTPERIAHVHNISRRTLYRLCEANGISLEQWIIRRRLEHARHDLTAPEHARRTIEAIGRAWGFTNPNYFSRRFRQTFGVTPSQWRRRRGED